MSLVQCSAGSGSILILEPQIYDILCQRSGFAKLQTFALTRSGGPNWLRIGNILEGFFHGIHNHVASAVQASTPQPQRLCCDGTNKPAGTACNNDLLGFSE
mmetsp:Transcript_22005/g.39957  ORF Transcript_22005/g.39957 Transcript_22005/m.39957 type:complete len:101 (-) Transcript_22005:531-833(-)